MALPGPAQNPNKIGRTPNAGYTDVDDVPYLAGRAHELPMDYRWHPITLEWWDELRTMPHCVIWTTGDWRAAVDLAILKDGFYKRSTNSAQNTEIRRREANL